MESFMYVGGGCVGDIKCGRDAPLSLGQRGHREGKVTTIIMFF